jgi:hypothetical protein
MGGKGKRLLTALLDRRMSMSFMQSSWMNYSRTQSGHASRKCAETKKGQQWSRCGTRSMVPSKYFIISYISNTMLCSARPDSSSGLKSLKEKVIIATLSNGTTRSLVDLVRLHPVLILYPSNTLAGPVEQPPLGYHLCRRRLLRL